jgi:hypothetical protein
MEYLQAYSNRASFVPPQPEKGGLNADTHKFRSLIGYNAYGWPDLSASAPSGSIISRFIF